MKKNGKHGYLEGTEWKWEKKMCGRRKEDKISKEHSMLRENLKEGSMAENWKTQEMSP